MQNLDRDEEHMSDIQFLEYKRVRDELDAAKREIETLRANQSVSDSSGMTDYQFKYIMELKDENTALKKEIEMLRAKNQAE